MSVTSLEPLRILHTVETGEALSRSLHANREVASVGTHRRSAVLLVSPFLDDLVALSSIFKLGDYKLYAVPTCRRALDFLRRDWLSVIICDTQLPDGEWKDILGQLEGLSNPPSLIVSSPLADPRFWAEVLNLGGYDVLAKPFEPKEVSHVVGLACEFKGRQRDRRLTGVIPRKTPRRVALNGNQAPKFAHPGERALRPSSATAGEQ